MQDQKPTAEEIKKILVEAVRLGDAEQDEEGNYRLTRSGLHVMACRRLLDLFNQRENSAYTFGALVAGAELPPEIITPALATLLSEELIHGGILEPSEFTNIFYSEKKGISRQLWASKDERRHPSKYKKHLIATLKMLRFLNNKKERRAVQNEE